MSPPSAQPPSAPPPLRVFLGTPALVVGGVNVFVGRLGRELRARGADARVLVTEDDRAADARLPDPPGALVERLATSPGTSWARRWALLRARLESAAPCIYLPNHDWRHSGISPTLSPEVRIVGTLHGDDESHYEHFRRLGDAWDATVCVSATIRERAAAMRPDLADRLRVIPCGVDVSPARPPREASPVGGAPLRAIYAGRVVREIKRVFDLIEIAEILHREAIPARITVVGGGDDEVEFRARAAPMIRAGVLDFRGPLPNEEVLRELPLHDVALLVSSSEGMPVSLLEAMGAGCAALVSALPSGVPDLVREGIEGWTAPPGDVARFAERLAAMARDRDATRRMGDAARERVIAGGYDVPTMGRRHLDLFEELLSRPSRATRDGRVRPPAALRPAWSAGLPPPLDAHARGAARAVRRLLGR